jgi:hypothetical protein
MTASGNFGKTNFYGASMGNSPRLVAAISLFLALFVGLSLDAARQKSPTADENFHLVAGYSYLKWGDYRINPEHPPLAKLWAALPLLAVDVNDAPLSREARDRVQENGKYGWLLANQWLFSSNDAEKLFFLAKIPMVLLGALLGLLVFCWARDLYALPGAFAALTLFVLDPNILAHSAIVHTDVPFAMAFFGGTYFFWRTLREVTWLNCSMMAGSFALSTVAKFSFVTILPIWLLLALARIFSSAPMRSSIIFPGTITGRWLKTGWITVIFISTGIFAYAAIWSVYGFHYVAAVGEPTPLGIAATVKPAPWLAPWMRFNVRYHQFPEAWMAGLAYALSTFNRTAYLFGEISGNGFWLYFPVAFAVKTPLPTLVLLIASLIFLLKERRTIVDWEFILLPIFVYFSLAVYSGMNIGLRHILPIYPFLFVWLSGTVGALWASPSVTKRCGILLLGIWLVFSNLKTFPDYLAFFNETVVASDRYKVLVDSNLDWGQDLKGLKQWMDKNGVHKIQLAYFGTADPAYYGIAAIHKPGTWSIVLSKPRGSDDAQNAPYIAISATHLAGVYFWPSNPYQKYLSKEPVAAIGGSIHVYKAVE